MPNFDPDLQSELYDNSFKQIITGGWAQQSSGNVECDSTGFFALIPISREDLNREGGSLWDAIFNEDDYSRSLEVPKPGYYVSTENNRGIIWVYRYSDLASAWAMYEKLEGEYAKWDAEENGDDGHYALSDCANWSTNSQGDCGGPVEERVSSGRRILCENCYNKPTFVVLKATDLREGDVLILPMNKTATIVTEVKVGRQFVSYRTEFGPSRIMLSDEVMVEPRR